MRMDSSFESDSDEETTPANLDSMITKEEATLNYKQAGKLVPEDKDQISTDSHKHLINPDSTAILDEVLQNLNLPYILSDFQKLSLISLFQKKDLILVSPTGSGKES